MPKVAANGIEIYYEQFGEASGRPLLLICGLGAHMTSWPQGFLDSLVAAGFFVTTYDNRDVGLSTHLDHFGEPDSAAILFGQAEAPYLIADMAADAHERLVDRLLASPRFGERMARHWFDSIHFADSHGFEHDVFRPNAWPYRDWVIKAFNDDFPWPTFVRAQLAADVFFPDGCA